MTDKPMSGLAAGPMVSHQEGLQGGLKGVKGLAVVPTPSAGPFLLKRIFEECIIRGPMYFKDGKLVLDLYEQQWSGYPSPIDLETFDMAECEATDTRMAELKTVDVGRLSVNGWSKYHKELHQVEVRSQICRAIGKELALTTLSQRLLDPNEPPSEIRE
jgi:hypothetical protein